jgi:hypothetical protein
MAGRNSCRDRQPTFRKIGFLLQWRPMETVHKDTPAPAGKQFALIVAVESYLDKGLDNVTYAEKDAIAMAEATSTLDFQTDVILSKEVTNTTLQYSIRQIAKTAGKDDTILFFFSGHGYLYDGKSYLLAHDSRRDDIENTATSIAKILEMFDGSECKKVMFFLDCCHSGMHFADEARGILDLMSQEELRNYFDKSEFRVVFSSCDKNEYSYPSNTFQHGYWTHHVLQALRGEKPELLNQQGILTSTALQDHLRHEVPKQLSLQSLDNRKQNPKMYGHVSGTFPVADLSSVLAKKQADRYVASLGLKRFTLLGTESGRVRDLRGFTRDKGHKEPTYHSDKSRSWVPGLAKEELTDEIDQFFKTVRDTKLYDNESLKYDAPSDGGAGIRTPDFHFDIGYSQSKSDPAKYVITRELLKLSNPSLLEAEWFNKLFDGIFERAKFEFSGKLDVNAFVNKAEKVKGMTVEYNGTRTECRITTDAFDGEIIVRERSMVYKFASATTPQEMIEELKTAHADLLSVPDLQSALPS